MSEEPYFDIDSIGLFSYARSFLRDKEATERGIVPILTALVELDLFFRLEALVLLEGPLLLLLLLVIVH